MNCVGRNPKRISGCFAFDAGKEGIIKRGTYQIKPTDETPTFNNSTSSHSLENNTSRTNGGKESRVGWSSVWVQKRAILFTMTCGTNVSKGEALRSLLHRIEDDVIF
jgi:hypothetical protein